MEEGLWFWDWWARVFFDWASGRGLLGQWLGRRLGREDDVSSLSYCMVLGGQGRLGFGPEGVVAVEV